MSDCILDAVGSVYHDVGAAGGQLFELGTPVATPSTTGRRMVAWIANYDAPNISGVFLDAADGAAFTFIASVGGGTNRPLSCWYLDNVPVGTHTVYVASAYSHGVAILQSWSNVDLAVAPVASGFGRFDAGGASVTVTGANGTTVVHALSFYEFDVPSETGTPGTAAGSLRQDSAFAAISSSYKTGANSVSFSWTGDGDGSDIGAILMAPITAAPAVATKLGVLTQPTDEVKAHHSFTITVAVQEAGGATVAGDTSSVTLTPSGTGTVTFSGNLTVSAVNGVATFTLVPTKTTENASITFTASSGSLTPAAAAPITFKVQSLDVTVS